jgi:hypothetical protein
MNTAEEAYRLKAMEEDKAVRAMKEQDEQTR